MIQKEGITGMKGESVERAFSEAFKKYFARSPLLQGEMKANGYLDYLEKLSLTRRVGSGVTFRPFSYRSNRENEAATRVFADCMQLLRYCVFYYVLVDQDELNFPKLHNITRSRKSRAQFSNAVSQRFEHMEAVAPEYLRYPDISLNAKEVNINNAWVLYGTLLNNFVVDNAELQAGIYKGIMGFLDAESNEIAKTLEYGGYHQTKSEGWFIPPRPLITSILSSKLFRKGLEEIKKHYRIRRGSGVGQKITRTFSMSKAKAMFKDLSQKEK